MDKKDIGGESRYDPPLPVFSCERIDLYGQANDDKNNYEESVGMDKKQKEKK